MPSARRALESAGVEFIDENGGGPGVRLRKRQQTIIIAVASWLLVPIRQLRVIEHDKWATGQRRARLSAALVPHQ